MKDDLFKDNLVQKMADKYNLTVPVFLLAWAMSQVRFIISTAILFSPIFRT